jgi:hypothetical protein
MISQPAHLSLVIPDWLIKYLLSLEESRSSF